jgi:hypothetical protein
MPTGTVKWFTEGWGFGVATQDSLFSFSVSAALRPVASIGKRQPLQTPEGPPA